MALLEDVAEPVDVADPVDVALPVPVTTSSDERANDWMGRKLRAGGSGVRGRANKQRVTNTRRHALVAVLVFELVLVLVDVLVDVEVREADRVLVRVLLLVLVALLVRVAVPVLVAVGVGSTNTKVDPNKAGFCSAMVLSSSSRFNCKQPE